MKSLPFALTVTACGIAGLLVLAAPAATQEYQPAKPGPEHALLKQMDGTWDATIKEGGPPGQPAKESRGILISKLDPSGLWLISDFQGTMMGQTFRGHRVQGYDPAKKKYTSVWIDSMSASMAISEGTLDPSGRVLTEISEHADPSGKTQKMKMVTEMKDKDTMLFTMFMPGPDGKEFPGMTITYKRKK
jgi:hypothetical protein